MAITYVGGQVGGRAGSTSTSNVTFALTGGTNSTPQAGDLVIIGCTVASQARTPACAISGYTAQTQINANGTTYDTSLNMSHKFMGGTPDTTFTLPSTGNNADAQRWTVQVWRGVDPTTPLDVTPVSASGTATGRPNPGSITPTTSGAFVGIIGAGAAATGAAYTAPANYTTNFLTGTTADTNDAMIGSGYRSWTSGAEDPAAYTGGTTNAADSWAAFTYALRPGVNNYSLTCLGGAYSLVGASAVLTYVTIKPTIISSVVLNIGTAASPGAQSITVPSDAQIVVVQASTYVSGGATLSLTSDFSGTFTTATAGDGSDKCHVGYAVVSSTGSKTITPTWSSALTDGPLFIVSFIKGVNTSDFLRESLPRNWNTQGATVNTTITSSSTDLVLILEREATTTTPPALESGCTSVTTQGVNNLGGRLQYTNTPGSSTTTLTSTGTEFPGFAAISIKAGTSSVAYTLTAQGGSYSLTGGSAILKRSKYIGATGGSYSLTGQQATITWTAGAVNYAFTLLGGTYALTGSNAVVSRNRKLTSIGGSYSLVGANATLLRSKRLVSSGGSYAYTGQSATLKRSKYLLSSGGSYTINGSQAVITRSRLLTAQGGTYTYQGAQATITYGALASAYTLTCLGGSYAVAGASAQILRSKRIAAVGGSYSISGQSLTLLRSKILVGSGGVYTITGQQAIINRNRLLTATSGLYSLTGSSAILTKASAGGYPAETDVRLGVVYGASGEYTGTLDVGKKFRLDIATGNVVMVLDGGKVMTL